MIEQIAIAMTGVIAIVLVQSRSEKLRRYACLFGLAGQPFWLHSAADADQCGVFGLSVIYAAAWGHGFWVHWVKEWRCS